MQISPHGLWTFKCKQKLPQTYFLIFFIVRLQLIQSTLSDFKDRNVVWVAVNLVICDWQCHGIDKYTTTFCPGDLFNAELSYS